MNSSSTVTTADGPEVAGIPWFANRGISEATLDKMPVRFGTVFFPELERKTAAILFRYQHGWKGRSLEEKAHVTSRGFKLSFWNLEAVLASSLSVVYIVEGEPDALALIEAGVDPGTVLSVPNGSHLENGAPSDDPLRVKGYVYVLDALKAGLSKKKRFIWCGDQDSAGLALRMDMARILGAARFCFVDWPEGIKDANDMLLKDGSEALHDLVSVGFLPWPVSGLFRLSELPEPPPLVTWEAFPEWESKIRLGSGMMSVVTGQPGHGKSTLFNEVWYRVAKKYDLTICQASFETRAKPDIRRQLRGLICGRRQHELSEEELRSADTWINEHYLFIEHPQNRQGLEWLLDMAEVAIVRHGAKAFVLDPWNKVEVARQGRESETEYILRCLRTCYEFAHDMNCHVQIVAHPSKMDNKLRGQPPMLEDISGSKNWDNIPDQGFTVHRPKIFDGHERKTEAALFHRKARFDALGYPCKVNLNLDLVTGSYRSVDYDVM